MFASGVEVTILDVGIGLVSRPIAVGARGISRLYNSGASRWILPRPPSGSAVISFAI